MRKTLLSFILVLLVGCSSHGSSAIPSPVSVTPNIVQTGSQDGWVHFALPYEVVTMVNGRDGNVWTADQRGLVRIGMDGSMQVFQDPVGQVMGQISPRGALLTTNPNGNLYVAVALPDATYAIAQVTLQGAFTNYSLPGTTAPQWITTGSDGNIWMIRSPGSDGEVIASISPQGTGYKEYPHGQLFDFLGLITGGPDGNLWAFDGLPFRKVTLVRISTADGSMQGFPAPSSAKSLVAMPDGGLWEANCHTYLTRFDTNGNAQQFNLIFNGKTATACLLAAGPSDQLYWAGQSHVFGFNVFTHIVQRYGALPTQSGSLGGPLIGPDQNFWTQMCCFDNATQLWVNLLHEIVAKPSSVTVHAGASASLSVTEKRGPNQAFTAVSNNPGVATVSGSGHTFAVTGVSSGSTVVTVSDSIGNSLDVPVTVQ